MRAADKGGDGALARDVREDLLLHALRHHVLRALVGLCTQALKLMDPEPVQKEEELTKKVEEWI